MRFLIYADVHDEDGYERLFSNPLESLQHFRVKSLFTLIGSVYKKFNCDGVVDLGDTTSDRNSLSHQTINTILESIEKLNTGNNYKLIGNHEQYLRNTKIHVGKLFDRAFKIIEGFSAIDLGDCVALFCSFPAKDKELADWLTATVRKHRGRQLVLFGHFRVIGAKLGDGVSLQGVPKECLNGISLGLLGDIHHGQQVTSTVYYVGSPFQQDFGEANDGKRIAIFDTSTFSLTWVPITGFPLYKTVPLNTWLSEVTDESENRYKVVVKTFEENEQFFTHPLSNRAQVIYAYGRNSETEARSNDITPTTFNLDGVIEQYVKLVDHAKQNIPMTAQEMIVIGKQIAGLGN